MMELYNGQDLTGWWVSEKFDGVQGVWDGEKLRTRTGNEIVAPEWWTRHLPKRELTGELWIGRGCFDLTRSIVMSKKAEDSQYWEDIRFLVFDPGADELGPYAEYIVHLPVIGKAQVIEIYQDVLENGGEGVVFMSPSGERSKLIPVKDDDGELIGFKEGKGRNAGRIGAFILRLRSGREIKLGNGLNDTLRERPPSIGSVIKFTYRGLTSTGLPRFASFSGVRAETSLSF
jgi:DNA ligase-1